MVEAYIIPLSFLWFVGIENPERKRVQYKKLQQMVDLVYSNTCYRKSILNYFGEPFLEDCNNCSNCLNEGEVVDKTLDAQKVIFGLSIPIPNAFVATIIFISSFIKFSWGDSL